MDCQLSTKSVNISSSKNCVIRHLTQVVTQCYVIAALRQEALKVDETSPWVLDITDVYYNIALVGIEHICTNLKNDIMVSCRSCEIM